MSTAPALIAELEALTTDQPYAPQGEGKAPVPTLPLKYHQIETYVEEMHRLQRIAAGKPVDFDGHQWQEPMGGTPTAANARIRQIRKILADQAPKKITGPRADKVYAAAKRVRDEVIKPAMLPKAAADKVPSGAVGHMLRSEFHPTYKKAALLFKRAIRALAPDNPDPDLTNLERFRPEATDPNGTSMFMADAMIPGNFAFGPVAKANWPLGPPTADTALKQAERVEQAVVSPATDGNGHGPKKRGRPRGAGERKPASPAQLAAYARMSEANRARAAARRGEAPEGAEG